MHRFQLPLLCSALFVVFVFVVFVFETVSCYIAQAGLKLTMDKAGLKMIFLPPLLNAGVTSMGHQA